MTLFDRWVSFESASGALRKWLDDMERQHPPEIGLRATLDEKRAQLTTYRALLQDVLAHQQAILDCRDKAQILPDGVKEDRSKVDQFLNCVTERHQELQKRAHSFVERYEAIVSDHQQYSKAVMDAQEWLEATHGAVEMWGDNRVVQRITLHANLERLRNLQLGLTDEQSRVAQIKLLGEKVIPGTSDLGKSNIRSQIDCSQQEWESLLATVQSTIEALENKLKQWNDYESLKDQCQTWLRQTDTRFHAIDLKATLEEKQKQLDSIKALQSELRGKELEIDAVTEKAQQLCKNTHSRSSQTLELGPKYQQIMMRIKELSNKWQQYVNTHREFNKKVEDCFRWLSDVKAKLAYCSDLSASSQADLEAKTATIQDLLMYKEQGFGKVQNTVELAQTVLANTAPAGHGKINSTLDKLKEEYGALASKMVDTKSNLDSIVTKWSGFLEQIQQLNKTVENVESMLSEISAFQATLSEKRTQTEKLKSLEEKIKCERLEVDSLKTKAAEMMASGQQSQAAMQAQQILDKFQTVSERVKNTRSKCEEHYRDHKAYKEAYDELMTWINRAREKVPVMKHRSLGDRLAIEGAVSALAGVLNKQAQGQLKVEELERKTQVMLASTSPPGQETIRNEVRALQESFDTFFKDVQTQKEQLERTVVQWREYKEEMERISDWLQQIDIEVKTQKNALVKTLEEKEKQVAAVQALSDRLDKGESQIAKFNEMATGLLSSHLDTYVNNQLRHLNSRYQVEKNLVKDVLLRINTSVENHRQYKTHLDKANIWIEEARRVIKTEVESRRVESKDELQRRLHQVQDLLKRQEEGQTLVHSVVNYGEKVARYTRSDGRDEIQKTIKDIQTDWDRLVRKMANAKVALETSLLQWADYSSSCSHLKQWITEKEAKLQQVCVQKVSVGRKNQDGPGLRTLSLGERLATLRRTNSFVQDIVSFEPMIESVTSKADDLRGQKSPASEISNKYQSLSRQAHEIYAKQKQVMDVHQSFIDAGHEFMHWLRAAKEKVNKLSEPTGDRESLSSKVAQVNKLLNSDKDQGQKVLEKALEKADAACKASDEEDREVVEEEVAFLQEEFDNYCEALGKLKGSLESGLVKWTEYEDQYQDAIEWLAQTESTVQGFNRLQNTLPEKRDLLEQFQSHLQSVFDWQRDLDRLNMRAQQLLETCADSRVSNAVTSITTKYNALLSLSKEIMRRLEVHFQEHQQHYALYVECHDWIERTREKLSECSSLGDNLSELKGRLQHVKQIKTTMEQGHHKLRYAQELKERVILNTESSGGQQIQEDTEILRQEFDRLVRDIQDTRQNLSARIAVLDDIEKAHQMFVDWLQELEEKVPSAGEITDALNDLSEKKSLLEKHRVLLRDTATHNDLLQRLKEKLNAQPKLPRDDYDASIERFELLKNTINGTINKLEHLVVQHDEFRQAYLEASDWIRRTKVDIQQYCESTGEKSALEEKLHKCRALRQGFPVLLVDKAVKLSDIVSVNSSADGQELIRQELAQLRADWDALVALSDETIKSLSDCLNAWSEYQTVYDSMKGWMPVFQAKVEAENAADDTSEGKLGRCKELLSDAQKHKSMMEDLNDRCEILMELSTCSRVREDTVQLQAAYTTVVGQLHVLVSRLEKSKTDHSDFINSKEEFAKWLERSHGTIQDCAGQTGGEEVTKEKYDLVRSVASRMSEGQHLMNVMMDAYSKALNTSAAEQQETFREDVARLRGGWDQMTISLNNTLSQLKCAVNRFEEFKEACIRMEAWLKQMDQSLSEYPVSKGEVGEMKTLMERLKSQHMELERKKPDLDHLHREAADLSARSNDVKCKQTVERFELKWNELVMLSHNYRTRLDEEITDYNAYHQALQDTEKWILQTSFHLMAHNSMYITAREQTEEQITKHNVRRFHLLLKQLIFMI